MRLNSCFMILCLLLLLLLTCVNHVGCSPSSSSSCGSLDNISSPFRLASETPTGGSPSYEILCDGGKPMLELGSAKYYVTNISYTNQTISVVDPVFVGDDRYCHLRIPSPPPGFSDLYLNVGENWALFVNCTRPIRNGRHRRVPCLSSNSTFVYVVVQNYAFTVNLIGASCGFLASVPVVGDVVGNSTATDIFELLKEGFVLSWAVGPRPQEQAQPTPSATFHGCLKEAKRYELRTRV
ncbi:uncharacterized protein LOC109710720 [Ananas comosus]|uniref:Uncharacterized protein LOC109710720 n=1 Tax=Ananas comosus TaxID=4615 RepID=A0A6P5EZY1_ANACO|nr:uncharacterized protein LOC109710720 [Ananas comosus]